jgi:hypothetical protein
MKHLLIILAYLVYVKQLIFFNYYESKPTESVCNDCYYFLMAL